MRPRSLGVLRLVLARVDAATPREVGERADVIGICVPEDAQVRAVVLGPDGVLAGASRAQAKQLTYLVGGAAAALETARPMLECSKRPARPMVRSRR